MREGGGHAGAEADGGEREGDGGAALGVQAAAGGRRSAGVRHAACPPTPRADPAAAAHPCAGGGAALGWLRLTVPCLLPTISRCFHPNTSLLA